MQVLTENFVELIRLASTDLRPDVEKALRAARAREDDGSAAQGALDTILENVALARKNSTPICQDTGTPIFYIYHPTGQSTLPLKKQIHAALATATERAYLRPNAVDSLTGKNSGNNLGQDFPSLHFVEWDQDYLKVDLLKGCAPGVLGVAIGGDRGSAYIKSKEQLFRPLDDENPVPELAALEAKLVAEANKLDIGPMGFGGKTTVLGVKIGALHRLPASYFVTISYMCWADRRRTMTVRGDKVIYE